MRILIGLFGVVVWLLASEPSRVVQAFNVKLIEAVPQAYTPTHTYYGRTLVDEGRIYEVVPRFSGFVTDLRVDRSWLRVEKGEALLSLYSPELFSAMGEYAQSIGITHPGGEGMRQASKRRLELLGLSSAEIAAIKPGEPVPEGVLLRAPASGVVLQKRVSQGSAFSAGQSLYTIADLSRLWVHAEIYQHEIGVLDRIQKAAVTLEGHGQFEARIIGQSPVLDAQSQSVTLRLELPNPKGRLQPGLFARVQLQEAQREILYLPASAVMPRGEEFYVFAEGFFEGEYEPRLVGAERIGRGGYEILWGLEAGQRVVSDALFLFDSDAEINMLY